MEQARPLTEHERQKVLEILKKYGSVQKEEDSVDYIDPLDDVAKNPVKSDDLIPDSGYSNPTVQRVRLLLLPKMYAKLSITKEAIIKLVEASGFVYEEETNGDLKFTILDAAPLSTLHIFYSSGKINFFMFS